MEKRKKEIVKMLLKENNEKFNEEELLDMLISKPIAIDVDKVDRENAKLGDKIADKITEIAGSWAFIIFFTLFLIGWILLNIYVFTSLDPYPFILLNLVLSCISAIQAPIIMMSQNREAKKEKIKSNNEYKTTLKNELILEELHRKMDEILKNEKTILECIDNEKK